MGKTRNRGVAAPPPETVAPGIKTDGDLKRMKENIIDRLDSEQVFLLSRALDVLDARESLAAYNIPSSWGTDNNVSEVLLDVARDLWEAALWGELRTETEGADQ